MSHALARSILLAAAVGSMGPMRYTPSVGIKRRPGTPGPNRAHGRQWGGEWRPHSWRSQQSKAAKRRLRGRMFR